MNLNTPSTESAELEHEEQDDAVIGRALRWSLCVFVALGLVVTVIVYAMTRPPAKPVTTAGQVSDISVRKMPPVPLPQVQFKDITQQAGITFVHENGAYGDKLLPETMGGGAAFFDFDNDKDPDILLINSQRWSWDPRPAEPPATLKLFQNDGTGQFQDVTSGSGLDVSLYGMGVAIGDYDNDGMSDVFVSAVGRNRLFHNDGAGKFTDVTAALGLAREEDSWSTSCGWFDYDNDRDLDLLVCNYVKWSKEYDLAQAFQLTGGGRAYGRPQSFDGTFPFLYRNDGSRFTDVSAEAGIQVRYPATGVPLGKSLGVTFADLDQDGWMDVIIANDTVQNFLFHNQQNGTFRERAMETGIAFDTNGGARGAMGISFAYVRNNDERCIVIGNFANEQSAYYVAKNQKMQFLDEAVPCGLGPITREYLTFGVLFLDFDLDGRLDHVCANGHLEEEIHRVQESQHYEQPPQLFWNGGTQFATEFIPMTAATCGDELLKPMVGRGATMADIDADGDVDLLLTASGGHPRLLRNDQQLGNHWLRIKLKGTKCNRDAIGSMVEVHAGKHVQKQQVMPTCSYLSQVELPLTFGIGKSVEIDKVVVHWVDGSVQEVPTPEIDQLLEIEQDPNAVAENGVALE